MIRGVVEESRSASTSSTVGMSFDVLDRMERAVAKVRERLLRSTAALNAASERIESVTRGLNQSRGEGVGIG